VTHTNISAFINNLPLNRDTTDFSTDNASGSTSQAAGIIEALEAGAAVLLMDEDTCATNFMIRDHKMQQLVHTSDEPITTFIDRVNDLHDHNGISTILVLGGIGDYFNVADHVIQMKHYLAQDVTERAVHIAQTDQQKRISEPGKTRIEVTERTPLADSIDATNQYGKKGIYAKETYRIHFGGKEIDLIDLEQLYELSQTRAIAFAMHYAQQYMDGKTTLKTVVNNVIQDITKNGLDILDAYASPNFAAFRAIELALTLNRMRGFIAVQKQPSKTYP
jgi:predicted ABC-class ATPase